MISNLKIFLISLVWICGSQANDFLQSAWSESEFDFSDKVVLITGASGGLGAHLAREFAKNGAHLIVNGRRKNSLIKITRQLQEITLNHARIFPYLADVTKSDQLAAMVNASVARFGRIDILINNAGGGVLSSISDPNLSQKMHQMMDLNFHSVVELTHLTAPYLERSKGVIVTISSILGQKANQYFMPYCAAKAAVDMFVKSIALELGPKGVRVNLVRYEEKRSEVKWITL
ncbi:Alcohol dehydrogenase-like protein, partial [Sarcoptes scabiei]